MKLEDFSVKDLDKDNIKQCMPMIPKKGLQMKLLSVLERQRYRVAEHSLKS